MTTEKELYTNGTQKVVVSLRLKRLLIAIFASLAISAWVILQAGGQLPAFRSSRQNEQPGASEKNTRCGKTRAIVPSFNGSFDLILHDPEFKKRSIENLAKAVQIPTEIQDVNPQPSENHEYYRYFYQFHHYLQHTYPLIHKYVTLEKVNELGLLYTWQGSEENLKPILFMAHQDVVPVERKTWDSWKYPPFSGYYDEETDLLWGRGSNDCKNLLTAEMDAIEQLLKDGFKPRRTVLMSFGFDEESSGHLGAHNLALFLKERYGKDGIYSIIDEGFGVISLGDDLYVAAPINGEKGYADVVFTVNGHGGHSSVPPDHTTIGVAAELITLLEKYTFDFDFEVDNPLYGLLTCVAEHSELVPESLKKTILGASGDSKKKAALESYLATDPRFRELIRTTRAVDIIEGGVKSNALPEVASFLINHRIEIHSSVNETMEHDLKYAKEIAKKHGYGLSYNNNTIEPETDLGFIEVSVTYGLEPAPMSPSSGPVWDLFAGTIQNVFENGVFAEDPEADFYISTTLISGNTDTRYYWDLSKFIYRFVGSLMDPEILKTLHSVDEHVDISGHLSATAFIYEYVINASENI
ncbi:hypothetical protein HG535_0H03530 [Zygotorulaspora mrakii]|uniref:Peptidase M20 dimerisation domain-containing protein n=1 Tax=Zygotorulaspora mrakii TaxID=42260 RepID=A0A7H9B9H2_ZYGMR|nr:uncharacterized protein HG535_0H03530 [Zygotorulaspora mrakii]QLG75026.1 hypothetical protein HG535_0H03530 [Zygotorulaspora mrakii]